jgi:ribosomal protein S19
MERMRWGPTKCMTASQKGVKSEHSISQKNSSKVICTSCRYLILIPKYLVIQRIITESILFAT